MTSSHPFPPRNLGLFQQLTLGAVRGAEAVSMRRLAHTDGNPPTERPN